jgi:opacity protein-like surface antigen
VGAAWHLPGSVTLRAEYTRFIDVGDKDKTGEINIDLFNVGVTYSFR